MAAQCPFARLFGRRPAADPAAEPTTEPTTGPTAEPVANRAAHPAVHTLVEAKPQTTFTEDLKSRTREQHDAAEHHPFHAVLFGSMGSATALEAYTRLLGQHLTIQEAFEDEFDRLSASNERVLALGRPHHRHLAALRDDLRVLDVTEDLQRPLASARAMAAFIRESARGDACAWIGIFYVLEGSTNGGTIIAKRLRELLQFADEAGTRYINPHGSLVRARWSEWKQIADSLTLTDEEQSRACDAAGRTFTLMQNVLTDIQTEMQAVTPDAALTPAGSSA